ncbi:hypothetical protein B0T25DRAFT_567017 [Lasiosphaeria hispida]|uniref:Uncharacterized protein n=1 Tax=Lasiosphaeria hispida TaxID=260671 RepID=A0AAJ0HMS6_9PEZI|nr:hypothetical protein B0T25DRAFT_567017 [Lasiosphaeria hispida]
MSMFVPGPLEFVSNRQTRFFILGTSCGPFVQSAANISNPLDHDNNPSVSPPGQEHAGALGYNYDERIVPRHGDGNPLRSFLGKGLADQVKRFSFGYEALVNSAPAKTYCRDRHQPDKKGYLGLTLINLDRFGQDAPTAYNAGHTAALWKAAGGKTPKPPEDAYALNAGDNENGLHVKNPRGESWVAYGDSMLLDTTDEQNLKKCYAALTASANEVFDAWSKA